VKSKFVLSFALAASLFLICLPMSAHHGNAAYDEKNPVTLKGTVTEFAWTNPHCQVYFDVKDDKGSVVRWSVESLSPGKLLRSGWTRNAVKVGDQITITLEAAKSGAPVGFLLKLAFADGRTLGIREQPNY
jgi:uncharacterized protein DUF6152